AERADIPGLDGGPDRAVATLVAPDGTSEEFVENEVILHTNDPAALGEFLDRYGGEVVRASDPMGLDGGRVAASDDLAGWYLIRIDPARASLVDLEEGLAAMGTSGSWTFSSEEAARLLAVVSAERHRDIGLNLLAELPCEVCEHPVAGGNIDAATQWWMAESSGLGIGVVHAWDYLRYQGFPPTTPYYPVMVAVVDGGFDLDTSTGMPLYGAPDYGAGRPPQLDEIDGDLTAGGLVTGFANHPQGIWHGQMTFGVCCANGGNGYGAAGTSGGLTAGARVETLLLRVGPDTWTIAVGIYDALYNNAEVVVANINLVCNHACRWLDDGNFLKATVRNARVHGAVVVAPSGNNHRDISGGDMYPCQLAGVVCVAGIQHDRTPSGESNWGSPVDVWAPTGILSAVTRVSANSPGDTDDIGEDELHLFGGTSCSAPYVGGIVALMMALDPWVTDVEGILAATANPVPGQPKITTGYVDAYQALLAVTPNAPPVVTIVQPVNGSSVGEEGTALRARVDDPEKSGPWGDEFENTVTFVSDLDGELCSAQGIWPELGCIAPTLRLGRHQITATGTDAFGATASATISILVADNPPTASITFPADRSRHPATPVNLVGYGFDPDAEIPETALRWSSDIDGELGTGSSLWVGLSPGDHTITLTVTGTHGVTASDSIQITVSADDGIPSVAITAPPHNTLVHPGTAVILQGTATDPEDVALTGRNLTWRSDLDGELGTGARLEVVLSGEACTSTVHIIT
ncbi:MAG: S8/S53 family peptidase, partial [Acidimicrobiia bacterium]|nr:S8/S53 family peptidase [Acidimicrobiia bacterium]